MNRYKVVVIVGSLRKDSHNLKLAKALKNLAKESLEMEIVKIDTLPLFNEDLEAEFPEVAVQLKQQIEEADAVLFVTPEYNRGMTAPLKNAIDWASRPYGKNSFAKKPAAICGASIGALGTACAQASLMPVLHYLGLKLMGPPEVYLQFKDGLIDAEGNITVPGTKDFLQGFADQFYQWINENKRS
jgi:chromate reductase